ncbi:MAG: transcription repressor NadR [Lachnospiraceae bacterium]
MIGAQRRKKILTMLRQSSKPLSGGALGSATGVSRQVVVQDIALLRTEGHEIVATARGYILDEPNQAVRVFKMCHTNEQTEEELTTIVDLGGCILDVMVNHRVYGQVTAPLNIRNRRDVQLFMNQLKTGKSIPLLNVTSGYHFHRISAESEDILDEIETALMEKKLLTELMPYELEIAET